MLIKHLLFLFISFLLAGCSQEWRGFVYPNKHDLSKHIEIGKYESLKRCREASLHKLSSIGKSLDGDYECGLNCRPLKNFDGSSDMSICEKTER
jgi:hypothetical protein